MLTRFLAALRIFAFLVLLGTWPEADAQAQNVAPIQNSSIFNSEGPAPTTGPFQLIGTNDAPPNGTTAGAIGSIAVDPSHPGTIYVGAVNGGIWKTTNGGTNWTPLIDQKASLSIASLSFDPTDPTHQTLIAGTGVTSNGAFASSSLFRTPANFGGLQNGLLYSRNGGTTWTQLGETTLIGQSVIGVAAIGNTILAATFEPRLLAANHTAFTGGLFQSNNSGSTFTKISGAPGSGLPTGPVSSLVNDPVNPNLFFAAVTASNIASIGQTALYVSRTTGASWQPVFTAASSGGLIPAAAAQNHQTFIRVAAGAHNTLAVGLVDATLGRLIGLFYSTNGGANWQQLPTPNVNPGGQAATNFALAIDPANNNLIYIMGDAADPGTEQDQPTLDRDNALAIFRVNAATNAVSRISDDNGATGNTANGSFVHPDGRDFAFAANGTLLTSTDGGLYARTDPQNATGVWEGLQGNLSTNELYALAYDANSKRLVVAMQDNGNAYQSSPGKSLFDAIGNGGDGVNAVVNDITLGNESAIYLSSQNLGSEELPDGTQVNQTILRLIVNQTGIPISPGTPSGIPVTFNLPVKGVFFFSPFVLNNIDKTRIALAGSAVYVTQDSLTGANGPAATSVQLSLIELGDTKSTITAIDYGTRNNLNALLAGGEAPTEGTLFFSLSAATGSLRSLPAYSGLAPTSVKFDLRSDQRFFAADSVNLFGSVNRGASFQTLTGNLPANFIRPTSLAFIDANGVDALLVGGLNNADNAGNPLVVADSNASGDLSGWRRFGSRLPNTTIFALSYNEKSDTLAVGTAGRGAFLLYDVTSNFASARVLQFGLANNDSNPDPAILFGNRPLIKYGIGTLTINGASTYTGSTAVISGTMAGGATNAFAPTSAFTLSSEATLDLGGFDQTIGSLAGTGALTNNGLKAAALATGNDNTDTTFSGNIVNGLEVTGITKVGQGTLTLLGNNTYSGGTLIQGGTLVAGTLNAAQATSFALGTGIVSLQGGILRTPSLDPLIINVGSNYVQGRAGTLALGVAGLSGKDYDRLQVQGNARLNGTLAVSSLNNFRPSGGNAFEILRTDGVRSGEFAQVNDSLNNRPNLALINLYAPNGVALIYASGPQGPPIVVTTSFLLPAVDPNAPSSLPLISLLDPTAEQLTSLYEISFSGTNTQRLNLQQRLGEIQQGSTGFASNLNISQPPEPYEGKNNVIEEESGKTAVEKQPVLQPSPENRWGVWVTGWGDFVSVGDDNFTKGYDFTTGGVTLGIDYRLTEHLVFGLFGSYAHTWDDLKPGEIDVNTGRGGLYATYFDHGFYLNAAVFGGYNSYDTKRQALLGSATGSTDGEEFSTFIGAGYDFHFGNFAVGPIASLQYTYVNVTGFNEQGSLVPLQINSDSQDSLRTDFGLRASYSCRVGSVIVSPSVTAAWEHEYKYSALPVTVSAAALGGAIATFSGPTEGHDNAIVTASVGVQWTSRISTFVGYQGQLGRDHYDANAVTGGVSFSF